MTKEQEMVVLLRELVRCGLPDCNPGDDVTITVRSDLIERAVEVLKHYPDKPTPAGFWNPTPNRQG